MNITLEVQVSEWANWVAQDGDGYWYEYSNEPRPIKAGAWVKQRGHTQMIALGPENENWATTLRRVND